jgi:hypothetical protein
MQKNTLKNTQKLPNYKLWSIILVTPIITTRTYAQIKECEGLVKVARMEALVNAHKDLMPTREG